MYRHARALAFLLPLPLALTACDESAPEPVAQVPDTKVLDDHAWAADLVGQSRLTALGEVYRNDCSGMVEAAYARAGTTLSGSSKDLYELASDRGLLHSHKLPQVGDVAFFDDTYDRNGNGRRDDELTHVAVVESVGADGTIVMVHKGSSGVTRINMNLKRPDDRRDEAGNSLNDYLRARSRRDSGPTLTGQLWRAFGSLWALPDEDRAVADSD